MLRLQSLHMIGGWLLCLCLLVYRLIYTSLTLISNLFKFLITVASSFIKFQHHLDSPHYFTWPTAHLKYAQWLNSYDISFFHFFFYHLQHKVCFIFCAPNLNRIHSFRWRFHSYTKSKMENKKKNHRMKEKIRRRNPSCCTLEEMVEWNNKT